jgi:hypothetical protein
MDLWRLWGAEQVVLDGVVVFVVEGGYLLKIE